MYQDPIWKLRRVLLLYPPSGLYRRDDRCQSKVSDQTVRVVLPPLELAYQAAVLEQCDSVCRIVDFPAAGQTWADFDAILREFKPDLLVIGVTYPTLCNDLVAATRAKELFPQCSTVARGEVFEVMDETSLRDVPALDAVFRGESEHAIALWADGEPPENIPGITYRAGDGEIRRGPVAPERLELDKLPYPARHLLNNELYRSPDNYHMLTTVQTSRGCPARCIFCPVEKISGQRLRSRSPQNVLGELEECVQRYKITDFLFHADTFTWDKRWVIEFCRMLTEKEWKVRWGCNSRVDSIDHERLFWMKKAGCWVIGFGVESGDEESLKRMRKGTNLSQAKQAFKLCREYGVRSHAFFMLGFPWETEEHVRRTIAFAKEIDPDFFDFNVVFPIPGTEMYRVAQEQGLLIKSGDDGGYSTAVIRTPHLAPEQMEALRRKALWNLYLRPAYVLRTLRQAKSLPVAWNYLKAAYRRAKDLAG